MPNEFDTSGLIHQWIYVIIPVGPANDPYFTAFCKGCRWYFSERVLTAYNGEAKLSRSSLPKYGCQPPDDVPVI